MTTKIIDTDDLDYLQACVTEMRAAFAKLLDVNTKLLSIIASQREDYEEMLAMCATNGSRTAADILRRLRAARMEGA